MSNPIKKLGERASTVAVIIALAAVANDLQQPGFRKFRIDMNFLMQTIAVLPKIPAEIGDAYADEGTFRYVPKAGDSLEERVVFDE